MRRDCLRIFRGIKKKRNSMSEQVDNPNNRSLELCKRVVTTESFIAEAKEKYGDRYDYSKVEYKNKDHRVTITCPIHGDFQVYAREHLDGRECPKCEKGDKFIKKLREKFGDKFGLEEFVYNSSTSPITLICPTHGAFSRLPNQILNYKFGCPECGNDVLRQLQEQLHQDAIEHKEERELARKERQLARKEAQRLAEEQAAKEKWERRIQRIIDEGNREREESEIDLFKDYSVEPWFEDFFGFNLKKFCLDDGTIVDGKLHIFIPIIHRPFYELKVEAIQGDLIQATLYTQSQDENSLYELFLVIENVLSYGFFNSFEQIKEKYEGIIHDDFTVDGIRDGYKLLLTKQWNYVKLKIRKIGAKVQKIRNNHRYDTKTLPKSFVGIDFETLYPQRVSACSVGMVKYIDGKIVDTYYKLIRPPFDYPGKCGGVLTWIHGLTVDMVKDEKTFEELLPEMENFVEGLPLVAHNACVERACIRDASAYYGVETKLDFENIYDTLFLSRQAEAKLGISKEGPGTHQLDTVCKRFGISGNNHHNALADAEMCGNLMVLFQKILCEGEEVEVSETVTQTKQKYNSEDKRQRTDLDSITDNPFKNQVVVLTGFAKSDSQGYAHKLHELGAIIKDGVNKKTNILITGYNAGPSKMQKAQEFGAWIISEEEFKEIINKI
jgi:DNA polymerase III epsilon subunit-like protein